MAISLCQPTCVYKKIAKFHREDMYQISALSKNRIIFFWRKFDFYNRFFFFLFILFRYTNPLVYLKSTRTPGIYFFPQISFFSLPFFFFLLISSSSFLYKDLSHLPIWIKSGFSNRGKTAEFSKE